MKLALLIVLVLAGSCGKFKFFKKSSQQKQDISKIYASGTLKVNVFYETGAEPFTDVTGAELNLPGVTQLKVFNVLKENLKALFPGKNIDVPLDLSQMSKISTQNQSVWSFEAIDAIGKSYGQPSAGDITVFNVFFVKGHSVDGDLVIGLHLSGTKTLMIFKDTVNSVSQTDVVKMYVEQSTLIHEMGHGIGLVNNGLPMTTAHEDTAHKPHCSNPDCVMYWQNEGFADLVNFAKSRATNLNPVMFDQACLKDVTSYK
ncbi:MAG: hypothetical protein ACJ76H_10300 [Bacteriovoracaceae bacterium]